MPMISTKLWSPDPLSVSIAHAAAITAASLVSPPKPSISLSLSISKIYIQEAVMMLFIGGFLLLPSNKDGQMSLFAYLGLATLEGLCLFWLLRQPIDAAMAVKRHHPPYVLI
ncbi:hypothetical protein AAC387_Pa11g1594 [Persea americana]